MDAIEAIDAVLNALEDHYCDSAPIDYAHALWAPGNAEDLLYLLRDGIEKRAERFSRFDSGQPLPGDLKPRSPV